MWQDDVHIMQNILSVRTGALKAQPVYQCHVVAMHERFVSQEIRERQQVVTGYLVDFFWCLSPNSLLVCALFHL